MFRIIATLVFLALMCAPAMADFVTWTDSDGAIHWPGWGSPVTGENSDDEIGDPMYIGGEVTFSGDLLQSISLDYQKDQLWNVKENGEYFVSPGDLFIDSDKDGDWDYVATSSFDIAEDQNWSLYSFTDGFDGSYVQTPNAHITADDGKTYNVRNEHPYAVRDSFVDSDGTNIDDISYGGLPDPGNNVLTTSWDFTGLSGGGLDILGDESGFIFAFAARCANDVVYEDITISSQQQEVPVPGAVWLLGSGLFGLVALRKRVKS